jgi:hypothetical protein
MGAITGGVTGSLSTTVISAGSPATLTLNATITASLGTYPILVNGIATSGATHAAFAWLTVNLGSSPGTTIQLGSISVQVGSATTPATIPPTIIVPPLPAGDSLTGCTSSPGTTAMLGTLGGATVQTLTLSATSAVQAGTTGNFSCTTGQGRVVAAYEQYWNIAQVELNATPQGGGSFQIQAMTNGFSEVDEVTLTGSDGTGDEDSEAGTSGDVTAYFTIILPAGRCVIDRVVAEGFGGDVDGGPAFAEGSLEVCYEPGPAPPTATTSPTKVVAGSGSQFSVTANASGGSPGYSYAWSLISTQAGDDPTVATISQGPNCNPQATCTATIQGVKGGKATLQVTVTDSANNQTTAQTRLIIVQVTQVNAVIVNNVGTGTATQTSSTVVSLGALLWPASLWTGTNPLVLITGSVSNIALSAQTIPTATDPDLAGALAFQAYRAPDDAAAVGGASDTPGLTSISSGYETLSLNQTGSLSGCGIRGQQLQRGPRQQRGRNYSAADFG